MNTSLSDLLIGTIVFFSSLVLSAAGISLFRRLSVKRDWLDHPNERSSHETPTPRGGGLIIVIVGLTTYVAAAVILNGQISWGYFLGACLVALISWLDDLYSLAYLSRLATHCLAAIAVIWDGGYLHVFGVSEKYSVDLGFAGAVITFAWIVWSINAYNFMDGIDGLAGLQGVVAASIWALITVNFPTLFVLSVAVAGACFGFLLHNWPPARMFMGDVGSAFLGFTFGSMPVLFAKASSTDLAALLFAAVLILWPFNFDAGLTRLRKALRLERFWEPHREHIYQRFAEAGFTPPYVCTIYGFWALAACISAVLLLRTKGWMAVLLIFMVIAISFVPAILVNRLNDRSESLGNDR